MLTLLFYILALVNVIVFVMELTGGNKLLAQAYFITGLLWLVLAENRRHDD